MASTIEAHVTRVVHGVDSAAANIIVFMTSSTHHNMNLMRYVRRAVVVFATSVPQTSNLVSCLMHFCGK